MFWNSEKKDKDTSKSVKHNNDNNRFITQYHNYCRTIALAHKNDPRPIYWEILCKKGSDDAWSLRQVTERTKDSNNSEKQLTYYSYKTLIKDLDFQNAVQKLSHYERGTDELDRFPIGKTIDEIGAKHFVLIAEQEGLVFDESGYPHTTTEDHVPETDGHFMAADIENATKNHATAKDLKKIHRIKADDSTKTLIQIFNVVALGSSDFDKTLDSIENLNTLDLFYTQLKYTCQQLNVTIENRNQTYTQFHWNPPEDTITSEKMGYSQYITHRWGESYKKEGRYEVKGIPVYFNVLDYIGKMHVLANDLNKNHPLKKQMQDTAFLMEATCNIIYANNLFQKNITNKGNNETTIKRIRLLQEIAEKILKSKLDIKNHDDIEATKQLIINGDNTTIPKIVTDYLSQYQTWRQSITKNRSSLEALEKVATPPKFPSASFSR